MINIERISMRLPAGFEHRAISIARLVGDGLSMQKVSKDVSMDSVSLSPMQISLNTSDYEIATLIVDQIVSVYRGVQI